MNESRHTCAWVTRHTFSNLCTAQTNESRPTYEWVVSDIRLSHVSHVNESRDTYEWVMWHMRMSHVSHIRMSRVWHTNESCLTIWTGHVTRVTWLMRTCVITHMIAPIRLQLCLEFSARVTWLVRDTHFQICALRQTESCHTHEWMMRCDTYEWVISHVWTSHVTHMNESCHTYEWVVSHIRMSHVTHMNESCHTYEWVMSHMQMRPYNYSIHPQHHSMYP